MTLSSIDIKKSIYHLEYRGYAGSAVYFPSKSKEYDYIITAKHNFGLEENESFQQHFKSEICLLAAPDTEEIPIINAYSHPNKDLMVLTIAKQEKKVLSIRSSEGIIHGEKATLCGFNSNEFRMLLGYFAHVGSDESFEFHLSTNIEYQQPNNTGETFADTYFRGLSGGGVYSSEGLILQGIILRLKDEKADIKVLDCLSLKFVNDFVISEKLEGLRTLTGIDNFSDNELKRYGVFSKRELFPAPPELDTIPFVLPREQHETILETILDASAPVIICAEGGVGKTVFAQQLKDSLPEGSFGVFFDCFGGGKYRNQTQSRHNHRQALVQIANELAVNDLCSPLIPKPTEDDRTIMSAFIDRLSTAVENLRAVNPSAILAVFVDAADNAEMAAKILNQNCFVQPLLQEKIPQGCRLVALCRTERKHLLKPLSYFIEAILLPFSERETLSHLRQYFIQAEEDDGREFHELTGGNPRVQALVLSNSASKSMSDILDTLGVFGNTVDAQIQSQLDLAILRIKEALPDENQKQIDSICKGLASLPPFIPIDVLSAAAKVEKSLIKSFVADLGRPIWLTDEAVQFRDEPTETWFRQKFATSPEQISEYVSQLKSLATTSSYVAEVLPSLLLQSEQYDELIGLALSDMYLPDDNPIDQRTIRVARLRFAFKAALKKSNYFDAAKLAYRAGEEVAGDQRQLDLLKQNTDLVGPLLSMQRVQELAYRRSLSSIWKGSESLFTAVLLAKLDSAKGEARSALRSADYWLKQYLQTRNERSHSSSHDSLGEEIAELALAHFHLLGPESFIRYIEHWRSPDAMFELGHLCVRKLVDAGHFDTINQIGRLTEQNKSLILAISDELLSVGHFLEKDILQVCLDSFPQDWLALRSNDYRAEGTLAHAIMSFAEACAAQKIDNISILNFLDHYVPKRGSRLVKSYQHFSARNLFLRGIALKSVLSGEPVASIRSLMPEEWERESESNEDVLQYKQMVGKLLPWYLLRARALTQRIEAVEHSFEEARQAAAQINQHIYFQFDRVPFEVSSLTFEIMLLTRQNLHVEFDHLLKPNTENIMHFRLGDRLRALRAANRVDELASIRSRLEQSCYHEISTNQYDDPNYKAKDLILLTRAVFISNPEDAAVYFNDAIEAVSKFGDEVSYRWGAVLAIGQRASEGGMSDAPLLYRFFRNAEFVGEHIEEKRFDRYETIQIGLNLDPCSTYAVLSRWLDRDIGWFDSLMYSIGIGSLQTQVLSPSACWALSAFEGLYQNGNYAKQCIEHEVNPKLKQVFFDKAVQDLSLSHISKDKWDLLIKTATQFQLHTPRFNTVIDSLARAEVASDTRVVIRDIDIPVRLDTHENPSFDWEALFNGLDLSKTSDFSQALNQAPRYNSDHLDKDFWPEVIHRVPENSSTRFLQMLLSIEDLTLYDFQSVLEMLPPNWRQRPSFQKLWPKLLTDIAYRFAYKFIVPYTFERFVNGVGIEKSHQQYIYSGMLQGLPESNEEFDASIYFSFISSVMPSLEPQGAVQLLDFALFRFEMHMPVDFGDGPWDDWLKTPSDPITAFSGFLWATLGSPRAAVRWQAAHCVRRLAELNCQREIDQIINWLTKDNIGAFGARHYPFYHLHARQYLLIALARIAQDQPTILLDHHAKFLHLALFHEPHMLIQLFSAKIALALERAFPGTYEPENVVKLEAIGQSPYSFREVNDNQERYDSPWHEQGRIEDANALHFGIDLPPYWFDPLGDVFGVPVKQIEELVSDVIKIDWQLPIEEKFIRDPRASLWRSRGLRDETRHSHGSYPHTDDYSFYLGYHGMMCVAAKLLKAMPVLRQKEGWRNKEWEGWLSQHLLTRADGLWLADRRDPMPLERRNWVYEPASREWSSPSTNEDLLDGLLFEYQGEVWLYTRGFWVDIEHNREERFHITSALVIEETADALLHALTTCQNHHDYRLPDYDDEDDEMEIEDVPFMLSGWIQDGEAPRRLDEYDPHAANIDYPPYSVGRTIVEQFELKTDREQREWFLPADTSASLRSEVWSEKAPQEPDQSTRHGTRIGASLRFLKRLCEESRQALIIEVELERDISETYQRRNYDREAHKNHKVYLLYRDGILRDTETRYCLREKVGDGA